MHVKRLMSERSDWLSYLETEFKINVVRDGDLVSLKYNQIDSPMDEPLVQECRGMVVDVVRNKILAHPYNKFWNHGESRAAPIDWDTALVQEKLDGSLMIVYWDDVANHWRVASSGTPRASGTFGADQRTFSEAFWQTFIVLGMARPPWKEVAFMFEFCDTPNRIVVRHPRPRIVLHGARSLDDGKELSHEALAGVAERLNWEHVRSYPIRSIADCLAAAEALDPIETEGFVVVDAAMNRVKIKSPRYVILHHLKGEATPRRAIELWQTGETSELLAHFPEMAPPILEVHAQLDRAAEWAVEDTIRASREAQSRKDFALAVKDKPWSGVCFKLYGDPEPTLEKAQAALRSQSLASLERLLDVGALGPYRPAD